MLLWNNLIKYESEYLFVWCQISCKLINDLSDNLVNIFYRLDVSETNSSEFQNNLTSICFVYYFIKSAPSYDYLITAGYFLSSSWYDYINCYSAHYVDSICTACSYDDEQGNDPWDGIKMIIVIMDQQFFYIKTKKY